MRTLPRVITLVEDDDGASDATRVMVGGVLAVSTGEPRDELLVAEASQDISPPAAVAAVVVRVLATDAGRGDDDDGSAGGGS